MRDSTSYEKFFVTSYDNFSENCRSIDETVAYANAKASKQTYAPYAYDATWMIVYAYDWAFTHEDISNASSVARGFRRLSNVETTTDYNIAPSSWVSVRGILSSSVNATVNVTGASGEFEL